MKAVSIRTIFSPVQAGRRALMIAFSLCLFIALAPTHATAQAVPLLNQPLSPTSAVPAGKAFTLTLSGTGFASNAVVNWNGSARATTFVSSSSLTAAILKTDIAKPGIASITVTNPGKGTSNTAYFSISKSVAAVSMLRDDLHVGAGPTAAATADFDGNGTTDLAVANSSGNSVSIFLGNGDGTFGSGVNYQTAVGFPDAILTGDFNGDGKLDLAVLLERSNQVSILLGNGDGTFGAHQEFSTGQNPVGFAAADLNGDGILDLAVANLTDNTVSILLGNGDGTFKAHKDYATGVNPEFVAVGDFNKDGQLDLAVPNNNDNTISILLNAGSGTFPTHNDVATAPVPTGAVVADFNNDGNLDLAVSTASHSLSVLLGNGDGTFKTQVPYVTGANSQMIATADLNADGKLDLAVANFTDNSVSVLPGNGDGTFKGQQVFPTNSGPGWIAIADLNGDGKLDMAVVDTTSNNVTLLTESSLIVTPTLLQYGNQEGGVPSAAKTFTLKNTGTTAITISTIVPVGTNGPDFKPTVNCVGSLLAGASCTVSVVFTPGNIGSRTGQIIVTESNGSSTGVGLIGDGLISVKLGPTRNYPFPLTLVGTTSKAMKFTFTNESQLTIPISSVLINGANYKDFPETNNCGTSVGPGASCTISVAFAPTMMPPGLETAAMNIFGNFTPGQGQQAVLLTGQSTAVKVTPTSLAFGTQTVGTTSAPKIVTFLNAGNVPLQITSMVFSGMGFGLSSSVTTCSTSVPVPANSTCNIGVTFSPQVAGPATANLAIGNADPTGPQMITLTGTGQ
jgi:hypothetical protein